MLTIIHDSEGMQCRLHLAIDPSRCFENPTAAAALRGGQAQRQRASTVASAASNRAIRVAQQVSGILVSRFWPVQSHAEVAFRLCPLRGRPSGDTDASGPLGACTLQRRCPIPRLRSTGRPGCVECATRLWAPKKSISQARVLVAPWKRQHHAWQQRCDAGKQPLPPAPPPPPPSCCSKTCSHPLACLQPCAIMQAAAKLAITLTASRHTWPKVRDAYCAFACRRCCSLCAAAADCQPGAAAANVLRFHASLQCTMTPPVLWSGRAA